MLEGVAFCQIPSGLVTQLYYLGALSIWMFLLVQHVPLCWNIIPIPFFPPLGIILTFSFFLREGGITIIREGCIPAGKVMQIFERVKNRVV